MWKWTRKASALVLGIVMLSVGVSCTSEDSLGPSTDNVGSVTPEQDALLVGTVNNLASALRNLHLLSCSTQPYAVTTKVVGPQGGVVAVGTHRLIIPAGALSRSVTIKAEQVPGNVNSVRFSPEGLQFSKTATVELSYRNCSLLLGVLKRVAYTDERLKILELIPSLDLFNLRTVTGSVRHFSRYAVAW